MGKFAADWMKAQIPCFTFTTERVSRSGITTVSMTRPIPAVAAMLAPAIKECHWWTAKKPLDFHRGSGKVESAR